MRFTRAFAMPNAATFSVQPIGDFVRAYMACSKVSVDPFARNRDWATYTNDIDPETTAQSHQDAEAFLVELAGRDITADLGIFDPPYSPGQIAEHYKSIGRAVTTEDTQNGRLYRRVRDALDKVIAPGGLVLSFGWQSAGMGIGRGYELLETLLVAHGGGHNDTICIAERKQAHKDSQREGTRTRRPMSAHTPGPWSIPHFAEPDTNCECGYVLCDHLMGAVATVHCSGEGQDWQRHGDNPKFAEACANARLIAAAPKMLAALRECTDDLAAMVDHQYKGMRDHPRYQRDMRPVYAARHVIAKAEPTRSVGAAQTITASCGHEITKVSDGVAVEYDDEDNGPEPGFEPCTVYATYCPKCAVEGAKAGNIRIITAD